jgi:hypothetical protein
LWLSNETPDRHGQGGQRRQYFQIAALVESGVEVSAVTLAGPQNGTSLSAIARLTRTAPYARGGIPSLRHRALVRRLAVSNWDAVVVAHTESWQTWRRLVDLLPAKRVLVDMHNVLSAWHQSEGRDALAASWRTTEHQILRSGAAISACSPKEVEALEAPAGRVLLLEHGIDPREWVAQRSKPSRWTIKLFGNWGWSPNKDGLAWFLTEVWPRVAHGGVWACEVAGSGMDLPIPMGVRAVGPVPSIADFLADATVVAVPVIHGAGAPVKYAEALVSGAPVLATLDGAPNRQSLPICVSDDAAEWERVLSDVVRHPHEFEARGQQARQEILHGGSWQTVCEPLVEWVIGAQS